MKELSIARQWAQGKFSVECETDLQAKAFLLLVADCPLFNLSDEYQGWSLDNPCFAIDYEGNISTQFDWAVAKTISFETFIKEYWKERTK